MAYNQSEYLRGTPDQVAAWIHTIPSNELRTLTSNLKARRDSGEPIRRSDVDRWVRDCTRGSHRDGKDSTKPRVPGMPTPDRPDRGSDRYQPPQVGAKDHVTVRDRIQYQARGLHLPYVRAAAYGQKVRFNEWTRVDLRAHDDPYQLTSGNGMTINQDGLWTILVKTDWSIGHAEVITGAAQATRLMINGEDCGLRDYLDDDAYTVSAPINTFTWTDEFRAGTVINIDVRTEGLGANYQALCNVYMRAYLVRCTEGEFDLPAFPLPANPPKPSNPNTPPKKHVPNPPLGGYTPTVPSQPAKPQYPNTCNDADFRFGVTVNDAGQTGYYKCVGGQPTVVWSSYGWDGGIYFGGGTTTGATTGGPGPMPWTW